MKREVFNNHYAVLANAYSVSQRLNDETQDVYWEMLKELGEAEFSRAVYQCVAECKFFPTIAEIGEAALPTNGLGYNWHRQIERRKPPERLSGNVRELIRGVANAKKF